MTLYVVHFTIPPKTRAETPQITELLPVGGQIISGSILFPTGCLGLVGVRISEWGKQIIPFPSGWVTGNGNPPVPFSNIKRMEGPNYPLIIEGYNMARDWPHTVTINFSIL